MSAATSSAPDTDGDGLVDIVEHAFGTLARSADTDGDGISDAEELARGSSPRNADSLPRERPIDVGIVAHSHESMLHIQFLVYSADGNLDAKNLVVSALAGDEGRVVEVSASALVRLAGLTSFEANDRGGRIFVLDLPIRPRTVYTANTLSVSASVAAPETGEPGATDVLDLVNVDGVICVRLGGTRLMSVSAAGGGGGQTMNIDATGSAQGTGSVFLPIFRPASAGPDSVGGSTNSTATPGQVCVQRTTPVGVSGGAVVREIVSSECVDGWDGFCSTSCSGALGGRIRSIDPVAFSGG